MQVTLLEGHTRGVRSVTWHPSGELLVRAISHTPQHTNTMIDNVRCRRKDNCMGCDRAYGQGSQDCRRHNTNSDRLGVRCTLITICSSHTHPTAPQSSYTTVPQYGTHRGNTSSLHRGTMVCISPRRLASSNSPLEIITISRSGWSKSATYDDKDVTGAVTALAVSPNGVYMASAVQGKVHVWSTQTRRIIAS